MTASSTVMAVQLQLAKPQWGVSLGGGSERATRELAVGGSTCSPDKVLAGVVVVQTDVVLHLLASGNLHSLVAGELQGCDEILCLRLGSPPALLGVQENVVHPEACLRNVSGVNTDDVAGISKQHINLDLVVLQGNQRQCKPGHRVPPKDERQVQALHRTWGLTVNKVGEVLVGCLLVATAPQGVVEAEPGAVMLVNGNTSDATGDLLDQGLSGVICGALSFHQLDFDEGAIDQVTIPADCC